MDRSKVALSSLVGQAWQQLQGMVLEEVRKKVEELAAAETVVEAAPERLALKAEIFKSLDGTLAAAALLILTLSIVLGITLREVHIDNSWTFDLDLFTLVWLSFIGAVLTSLRDHHVTAGIALENLLGGRGTLLAILRFAIVAAFLVMFAVSGYRQAQSSLLTHETTLDVAVWPVWAAKAALPLGAALWLVAETHKLLRRFTGKRK